MANESLSFDDDADAGILRVVIGEDPPDRLDKALAREVPEAAALSRSRLMKMIAEGDVALDGVAITNSNINRVFTGDGNDTITGDGVSVFIDAGRGNDRITGGSGNETLNGGRGNDTFRYVNGNAASLGEELDGGDDLARRDAEFIGDAVFDRREHGG